MGAEKSQCVSNTHSAWFGYWYNTQHTSGDSNVKEDSIGGQLFFP